MKYRSSAIRGLSAAIILTALGIAWLSFAPTSFGGSASYVIVAGASMHPALEKGDLVITRRSDQYEVDDVVTYSHPELGPIIHRIIDREGEAFIFKGDANEWTDDFIASSDSILGKEWIHVRKAASVIHFMRTPAMVAILSIMIAASIFSTILSKEQIKMNTIRRIPKWNFQGVNRFIIEQIEGLYTLFGVVLLACFILGIFAFTKPLTQPITISFPYTHEGIFEYHADADERVYSEGELRTGDPVFLEVIETFDVGFTYSLQGQNPAEIAGRTKLDLVVRDVAGWNRLLEIQSWQRFMGAETIIRGAVNLKEVLLMIDELETSTGLTRTFYEVYLNPVVELHGKVDGRVFQDSFSPSLAFQLNEIQLQLITNSDSEEHNPLAPMQVEQIIRNVTGPNTINILGINLPIISARWIAGIGILISLGGILFLSQHLMRSTQQDPMLKIQARYTDFLVEVQNPPSVEGLTIIEVSSIEDLARLAQRQDQVIEYTIQEDDYSFYVRGKEEVYIHEYTRVKKSLDQNSQEMSGHSDEEVRS